MVESVVESAVEETDGDALLEETEEVAVEDSADVEDSVVAVELLPLLLSPELKELEIAKIQTIPFFCRNSQQQKNKFLSYIKNN